MGAQVVSGQSTGRMVSNTDRRKSTASLAPSLFARRRVGTAECGSPSRRNSAGGLPDNSLHCHERPRTNDSALLVPNGTAGDGQRVGFEVLDGLGRDQCEAHRYRFGPPRNLAVRCRRRRRDRGWNGFCQRSISAAAQHASPLSQSHPSRPIRRRGTSFPPILPPPKPQSQEPLAKSPASQKPSSLNAERSRSGSRESMVSVSLSRRGRGRGVVVLHLGSCAANPPQHSQMPERAQFHGE
jgi:hypothetical protein